MEQIEIYSVYILALNQYWEMPVELAKNLSDFLNSQRKINRGNPLYIDINKHWLQHLSKEQKMMIKKF